MDELVFVSIVSCRRIMSLEGGGYGRFIRAAARRPLRSFPLRLPHRVQVETSVPESGIVRVTPPPLPNTFQFRLLLLLIRPKFVTCCSLAVIFVSSCQKWFDTFVVCWSSLSSSPSGQSHFIFFFFPFISCIASQIVGLIPNLRSEFSSSIQFSKWIGTWGRFWSSSRSN